jgi:8-oxo-dGTP pyrophosphatase MutT (NUDIX family)
MAHRLPHAAGCVIVRKTNNQTLFLLILDQYGRWTFPKGHLDEGESSRAAALREVLEETGISGELGAHITTIYYDVTKKARTFRKQVDWYLLYTDQHLVTPQAEEGIHEYAWLTADEVEQRLGYPALIDVFGLARTHIPMH